MTCYTKGSFNSNSVEGLWKRYQLLLRQNSISTIANEGSSALFGVVPQISSQKATCSPDSLQRSMDSRTNIALSSLRPVTSGNESVRFQSAKEIHNPICRWPDIASAVCHRRRHTVGRHRQPEVYGLKFMRQRFSVSLGLQLLVTPRSRAS